MIDNQIFYSTFLATTCKNIFEPHTGIEPATFSETL